VSSLCNNTGGGSGGRVEGLEDRRHGPLLDHGGRGRKSRRSGDRNGGIHGRLVVQVPFTVLEEGGRKEGGWVSRRVGKLGLGLANTPPGTSSKHSSWKSASERAFDIMICTGISGFLTTTRLTRLNIHHDRTNASVFEGYRILPWA
jgi:hypothetical protein